jgi:ABC-type phosphate/phosphonate transport system substrate-binding protein
MRIWLLRMLCAALAMVAPAANALVFAVNEGVTYRVSNDEIRARYAGISADLTKILGQPVTVEPVGHYPTLREGLQKKAYDLAIVHPAHISIQALQAGWRLVAVSKGYENYAASFLVRADSPLKSLAELKGRKLGAPDEDSITSWMVRATMRDALGSADAVAYTYTRYQDAVPFMVEHTFTQAGATASGAVIKDWQAAGGKVLAKSKPVPIKHVIASPSITPEQVAKLREYFVGLDTTEEGRRKLEPIKIKGYMAYDTQALLQLGQWLGVKAP